MDANNWWTNAPGGELPMDTVDWRSHLPPDSRQRIVKKISETLKRHLPLSGPEGLLELEKIAVRFEEKIYTSASSQPDYLRKISIKMLTMENKHQNAMANSLPANSAGNCNRLPDTGASHSPQLQVQTLVQSAIPLSGNQLQPHQQLLSQNIQNSMASAGVQSSADLASALSSVSGITQTPMASVVGQNSGMQNIPSISQAPSMSQSSMSNLQHNSLPSISGVSSSQPQPQVPQEPANFAFSFQRDNTEHQLPTLPPPPKQPTLNCPICFDPFVQETSTKCGHIFCKTCILSALKVRPECPTCRRRVLRRQLFRVFLPSINYD